MGEMVATCEWKERVEIDTSAPFGSVKEAVDLFGGRGSWKPSKNGHQPSIPPEMAPSTDESNDGVFEEQIEQLPLDLKEKEQETLNVLTELEKTKAILENLKSKMSGEQPADSHVLNHNMEKIDSNSCAKSPDSILFELENAKENLNIALLRSGLGTTKTHEVLSEIQFPGGSTNNDYEKAEKVDGKEEVYQIFAQKVRETEELCRERIEEANKFKLDLLKKVEKAKADIEHVLEKIKVAKRGETTSSLRAHKRRAKRIARRRSSIQRSPKFKNTSRSLNSSPISLSYSSGEASRSVLSIGEILKRKLMGVQEPYNEPRISLQQMLIRQKVPRSKRIDESRDQSEGIEKKCGLKGLSLVLAKHNINMKCKKNKKKKCE